MILTGHTARLLLKPLALADAPQIQQVFPHWEIVRYLMNVVPWPYPPNGARQFIEDVALPQMALGEAWHWTLRLKAAPDLVIGSIGLKNAEDDHRGFWLAPSFHGQGFMSEACVWVNDFWFDTLRFPVLRVSKAAANSASRRISEKHGMRLVGTREKDYVSGRAVSDVWEITAQEWRAWKDAHLLSGR
jgi:RimJ/RimL family protein N-acetyltransferase